MSVSTERTKAPLWLLVLITISGTLAMHMFVPALPDAASKLGVSTATAQMTISVYIMGLAVGQLIYGPLSDAIG
ncbi:MAG: Bcr/CflA family drug resistance efflux transporter, partial [Rhodoferax sp.]|nr:Bcr/CflA family drug resistance efflux transporter [Rhodoferax sp.]